MSEIIGENETALILFAGFFFLYGLEFLFPLVRRRSNHLLSNLAFAAILILINLLFTSLNFITAEWVSRNEFGLFQIIEIPKALMIIISIVFLDLWAGYLAHFVFHKNKWLWRLHSVHHSDDLVDVTTTFRLHPVEIVIKIFFHVSGIMILGIPIWLLLIYLTLSTANSQLEHANIKMPGKLDKFLQYFLVTPNMHKIHHSKYQSETDSNYSNIFSVWDRMFGTYRSVEKYDSIHYGLDYLDSGKSYSFWELIRLPFKKIR